MPVILLSVGCLKALKTLKGPYLKDGIRGGSRGTHEVVGLRAFRRRGRHATFGIWVGRGVGGGGGYLRAQHANTM